ncbi:hypothetical protein CN97_18940 [Haematobacter massiliensis]|uniref:Uncharacterized protein n=3 Tax=Haematobacter massiliensis TaxID=195105 RepID=A0A086Y2D5_9RHOB|nr:lanthionine synthetase LanC family protein [Haematobacter massiliensis]KFI28435.1 hypothetical protein CN97_18940 [Haematobacter massiliensis]OWJ84707.1 hypothetical protein CDV51_13610 [Haematobacter massiliensis]QBJ26328.1 hypothetical protein HmaOT1_18445 [Haematobacter massiliensis]
MNFQDSPDFRGAHDIAPLHASDYRDVLISLGVGFVPRSIWLGVGAPKQTQGWKFHVSTVPTQAEGLIRDLVPMLAREGIAFKIARDTQALEQLNEGALGETQVGKFMTIYDGSPDLARRLCALTAGRSGPAVPSDLQLGDVVFTRYGAYEPVLGRDALGQITRSIRRTDGTLQPDAYTMPFVPPDWADNPFRDWPGARSPMPLLPYDRVAERFTLVEVIRRHAKGDIFLALDLASREEAEVVVLKQGRAHGMADAAGRDIRDRMRHQHRLLTAFSDIPGLPRSRGYVEWQGCGYLALTHCDGRTIESAVAALLDGAPWARLAPAKRRAMIATLDSLAGIVEALHARGHVHRDISASNVLIDAEGGVSLVDLELADRIGTRDAFGKGTVGFMSPQQDARLPPATADDIFALGKVLLLTVTGLDPRRLALHDRGELRRAVRGWTGGIADNLLALILDCTDPDPARRPGIVEFRARLTARRRRAGPLAPPRIGRLLNDAARGLLSPEMRLDMPPLWVSLSLGSGHGSTGQDEVYRSVNRGNAGVLYGLARLARAGLTGAEAEQAAQAGAAWLCSAAPAQDRDLPGLHFGEAGVDLALACAHRAGLTQAPPPRAARVVPGWLDVTHGAAGIGLAALQLWEMQGDPGDLAHALACADRLVTEQTPDGCWVTPEGVAGLSGDVLTGFAHGAAGMGFLLVEAAARTGRTDYADAAWRTADWLLRCAQRGPMGSLIWPYSAAHPTPWRWWCHGGPGIALFFLRAYRQFGDPAHAEAARSALRLHGAFPRSSNLTLCHGLSGLGHAYLEAAEVLAEPVWRERAAEIGAVLADIAFAAENGGVCWLAEHPRLPTADFMVGNAGIVDFLARLHMGKALSHPLLPEAGMVALPIAWHQGRARQETKLTFSAVGSATMGAVQNRS